MIPILSIFNFLSMFFSIIFQFLLVQFFRIHLQTDIYYLSISIIQFFFNTFSGFIMDLYIPFYNERKVKSEKEASEFFGSIFLLMFFLSTILSIFLFSFSHFIIKLFASGFSKEKIIFTSSILKILCLHLVLNSLNYVIDATLQANLYFIFPFFLKIFPPIFNILSLLFFSNRYGIKPIIFAMVFSSLFNFILFSIYSFKKIHIKFVNPLSKIKHTKNLIKYNLPLRLGAILWELTTPITMNVLSFFPSGYITLFNWSQRILDIIFGMTVTPSVNVFYAKVSKYLPEKKIDEIKKLLNLTIRSNIFLFMVPTFILLSIFKKVFVFIFYSKVSISQIEIMYHLLLFLAFRAIIFSFEKPFTLITFAMKKTLKILQIAIVFFILYSLLLVDSINYLKIYSLPFSLTFSQIYNTFSYFFYVNRKLKVFNSEMKNDILKFGLFLIFLVIFNLIFENKFLIKINLNILIFLSFSLIMKKEIFSIYNFLFKKTI